MAHNLSQANGEYEFAYVASEGLPWHGLGRGWDRSRTPTEAVNEVIPWGIEDRNIDEELGYRSLHRSDDGRMLSIVKGRYKVLDNNGMARVAEMLFKNLDMKMDRVDTIGALGRGQRVFFGSRFDSYEAVKGDEIKRYLLMTNSFDGSGYFQMMMTNIRVVCQNTLNMAMKANSHMISIRHSSSMGQNLINAVETYDAIERQKMEMQHRLKQLSFRVVTASDINQFNKWAFPEPAKGDIEVIAKRKHDLHTKARNRVSTLFEIGRGAGFAPGTGYQLYQAYTEYTDHFKPIRNGGERWIRSTFDDNMINAKERALVKIEELAGV